MIQLLKGNHNIPNNNRSTRRTDSNTCPPGVFAKKHSISTDENAGRSSIILLIHGINIWNLKPEHGKEHDLL